MLRSLLLLLCLSSAALQAQPAQVSADHVRVDLVSEREHWQPGETAWLGLHLAHDPHWHTYWTNPGDSGLVTRLRWTLPDGIQAGEPAWPHPQRFEIADIVNFGYGDDILLPIPLQIDAAVADGEYPLTLRASWLICEVECIPGQAELGLTLKVRGGSAGVINADWQAAFSEARARAPVEVSWPARFAVQGQQVVVEIDAGQAWQPQSAVAVFPAVAQFVSYAQPRQGSEGDTWQYVYALSDFYDSTPERFDLVLVGGAGSEPRAVRLQAEPGEVVAAAQVSGAASASTAMAPAAMPDSGQEMGLGQALLFALLGGLVLNLMPCVFPVLSLKALTLKQDPHLHRHGVLYTVGVVISFLSLAIVLLLLRQAGEALGWGFQLQSPGLIAALAVLFFAMGLSLSGVISFGERLMGLGQNLAEGESDRAAFMTGVLAAVVASPCTAPLMGAAMGYAITQPAVIALAVFATLGLGLALPFLALSFIPALTRFMPRPGPWMEGFKQFLAFPMYATVVWLIWVYGNQQGINAMGLLSLAMVGVGLALWAIERARRGNGGWLLRGVALLALVGSALAVIGAPVERPGVAAGADARYEAFSQARLDELTAGGTPVLVNMTAAWCITCLANERVALSTDAVQQTMAERGVAYLKGDWTSRDDHITEYLARFGRTGVPLYVYYRPGQAPEVLPQLLTPDLVVDTLTQ
ncbi:MAG: protein-disulfide reductase DsbD family protein [Lysobacterales bacterium]